MICLIKLNITHGIPMAHNNSIAYDDSKCDFGTTNVTPSIPHYIVSMIKEIYNNNTQIVPAKCEVWGDPDVHNLTPTRTRHIERPVPTNPQKTFFTKKYNILKTFCEYNKMNTRST